MPRHPEGARPTFASCTQGHAAQRGHRGRIILGGSPRDPGLSVLAPVPTAVRRCPGLKEAPQ